MPHLPQQHVPGAIPSLVPSVMIERCPELVRGLERFTAALWSRIERCPECCEPTLDALVIDASAVVMTIYCATVADPDLDYPDMEPSMRAAVMLGAFEAVPMMEAVDIERRRQWAHLALTRVVRVRQEAEDVTAGPDDHGLVWRRGRPPLVPRPGQRVRSGGR